MASPDLGCIQTIGGSVYLASSALFAALSSLEIVAARWIGQSLKKGALLGIIVVVTGFILSIGMVLPIWLVLHPVKFLLLLIGWENLH